MPEVQGTYDSPELTLEDEGKSRIRVGNFLLKGE